MRPKFATVHTMDSADQGLGRVGQSQPKARQLGRQKSIKFSVYGEPASRAVPVLHCIFGVGLYH